MDNLFKPVKQNYFGKELYGDDLYKKEINYPSDSTLMGRGPDQRPDSLYKLEGVPDSTADPMKQLFQQTHDFSDKFMKVVNSSKWAIVGFTPIYYITFSLGTEDEQGNLIRKTEEFSSVLVQTNYTEGLSNRMSKSKVLMFVPFEAVGVENGTTDSYIFNRVYIQNRSNPSKDAIIRGICRSPIAVTKNPNHFMFDKRNCSIYNNDFFQIEIELASYNLIKL